MAVQYTTTPPTLTFRLLQRNHIELLTNKLKTGAFILYMKGTEDYIPTSDMDFDSHMIVLTDEGSYTRPESSASALTEGVLLVTTDGGLVTALNLNWITGGLTGEEASIEFFKLGGNVIKNYLHPRLLENIIKL